MYTYCKARSAASRDRFNYSAPRFEQLELREVLSASGFVPDYLVFAASSSSTAGYTPAQIRTAYGFNSLSSFGSTPANGSGQTIAIIDAYNDPNITSDLAVFDQAYGIAAPPSLKIVNENGGTNLPGTDPSQGWETETALDVEWAHAIAPGANILLVEASSASDTDLFAAVNYAREQPGVSVISMSWGSDDNLANQQLDTSLSSEYLVTPSGHQGITFVASSGDHGVPNFPAESPNVLAVGGTDLYLTTSGSITSETAWTPETSGGQVWSGGGGVSKEFPGRDVPDVSYNAGVGMAVYNSFGSGGGWESIGGTSAGAPEWAALVAIADQGRVANGLTTLNSATQTRTALFAAPSSDFHDITTGSTQYESAGPGYDLATGLGSPVANLLIPYLASYNGNNGGGGGGGTSTSTPAAPSHFIAQAVSPSQVNLSWMASSGATGYDVYELEGSQSVLLQTLGSGATSATVTGLSAGTNYSFEVSAFNSAGAAASGWQQVTTLTAVSVSAPTNVQLKAQSSTTVNITWDVSSGATSYQVYERIGSQSVLVARVGAGVSSVTIGGLKAGSTDYFSVTAQNATSSASTPWLSIVMPNSQVLAAPRT